MKLGGSPGHHTGAVPGHSGLTQPSRGEGRALAAPLQLPCSSLPAPFQAQGGVSGRSRALTPKCMRQTKDWTRMPAGVRLHMALDQVALPGWGCSAARVNIHGCIQCFCNDLSCFFILGILPLAPVCLHSCCSLLYGS